MKNKIKQILNVLFLLLFISITFYIVFKNNNINVIIDNIKNVKIIYIIIAFFCMFIFVLCEGLNIKKVLNTLNTKITFLNSFKYALVGFFFSSITPASSGGDPAQLYFMNKDNVPLSASVISLLTEHASFQLITCILALIGFIFNYNNLINSIGNIKYLLFLGIFINIIYLTILVLMIFSKKISVTLINYIYKILNKLHYKNSSKFYEKSLKILNEYNNCSLYLKSHKSMFIKIFLTSLIQILFFYSIPYFIYLSFGLQDASILNFILLQAVIYTSVSSLPFPGSVGVSEGSFLIVFKLLFPINLLSSAMILDRAISYYIFVLISGLLLLLFSIIEKYKKRKSCDKILRNGSEYNEI